MTSASDACRDSAVQFRRGYRSRDWSAGSNSEVHSLSGDRLGGGLVVEHWEAQASR